MTNEEPRKVGVRCWWEPHPSDATGAPDNILHIERVRSDGSVVTLECERGEAAAIQLFFALP